MTWIGHDKTIFQSTVVLYTCLIAVLAAAVLAITAKEHAYESQHETILADFNRYMATMHLIIILMDDGIKHMCIFH